MAFVGKFDRQAVALAELFGEAPCAAAGGLFFALERERQADHQRVGQPLLPERIEPGPVGLAIAHWRGADTAGTAGQAIADRDADQATAVIESEHTAHAWPA
ncbi:hypothetical protein CH75_02140 [Dyella jiangningensis]|nr:hypothetical protein CH75_02140 [Dyella jiangningensis]